jgi:hypothetical protein
MPEQTYATHRRWHPIYHFVALPIIAINLLVTIWFAWKVPRPITLWAAIDALAILILAFVVRDYATRTQDRIIRLEETLRLGRVLPADLQGRVGELTARQLTALRFCHDDELPDVTRAVLAGELKGSEQIKQRIQKWRADHHRV